MWALHEERFAMDVSPSTRIDVERNRRVLLDAAAGALALNPDASLSEVAHLAGLTRATLYRHFGSRENLIVSLREDALACAREVIAGARIDEGSATDALGRVVSGILALGGRFRPLLMEGTARDPEFLRQREHAFAPVAAIVQRGQRSGELRDGISAQWIVIALVSLLAAAVRAEPGTLNGDVAGTVLGTLISGIRSEKSQN